MDQGSGQVGLYELPTTISQSPQRDDFSLIMYSGFKVILDPNVGCRINKNRQCRVAENTPLWILFLVG